MKLTTSLIRRPDGLRTLDCLLLNVKQKGGGTKCIAESRRKTLRPHNPARPLLKHEKAMLKTWSLLGKATLSQRTYNLLYQLCAETTAAPTRTLAPVPKLTHAATDIRPWLCDPMAIASLFTQLLRFDQGKNHGHQLCRTHQLDTVDDPWFLSRSGERIALGEADISAIGWEYVASFTRKISYAELKEIEAAYLACQEEKGASEIAQIILGHTQGETGAHWINFWMRIPKEVRNRRVKHWLTNHAKVTHCPRALHYLAHSAYLCDTENYRGICYLLNGLEAGAHTSQLADGIALWKKYGLGSAPEIFPEGTIDTHTLNRLVSLLAPREDQSWQAAELWSTMHKHPMLQESIAAILDEPNGHRSGLFNLLRKVSYGSRDDQLAVEFNRDFKTVSQHLQNTDEAYRRKAIHYFEYVYWDRSTKLSAADLIQHVCQLCTKPFTQKTDGRYLWCKLLSDWQAHELPLASWKRIDSASRSRNNTEALESALNTWDEDSVRPLLKAALKLRIRLSLEILRLTEQSPNEMVKVAFENLGEHPLMDVSLRAEGGIETYRYLLGDSKDLTKWQQHLNGTRPLRVESAAQVFDQLEGQRVEALLNYFKQEITASDTRVDGLHLHTRLYAKAADENRRAYTKLVRRYQTHGEQGILAHPRNQLWLRDHPFVRQGVWLTGLRAEIELPNGNRVFLEMERRFEQVLKMGTLVNSCLSLGGCNSHSALANAADINKQVVMAYDSENRFLARQLIGISEQRELVVFDVYGNQSSHISPAFAAFDIQLENLMALPIHREGDYEIKPVVCKSWYDDYSWTPSGDDEVKIIDRQWGGSRASA